MSRIVHLFNSSLVSGPENLVLRNLAGRGWPMEIWNLEETRTTTEEDHPLAQACRRLGFVYRPFVVKSRWDPEVMAKLREYLIAERVELLHAHDVKASTYALGALRGLGPRRPRLVSTHHGIDGRPDFKTKLYERFYRYIVLPRFDAVLTVSSADEKILRTSSRLASRLHLHRNGLEGRSRTRQERALERHQARGEWGVAEEAKILGFVGRLSPEKNPLKALETLRELPSVWRLVVAGVGSLESDLREYARAHGIQGRVVFLGYRPGISQELAGFDLVLCVSRAEGLPLFALEAGWAGTPVLAHRVGGLPEVLGEGAGAFLVDPDISPREMARRIELLDTDPDAWDRAGEALKVRVESDFSGQAWRQTLQRVYEAVGFVQAH